MKRCCFKTVTKQSCYHSIYLTRWFNPTAPTSGFTNWSPKIHFKHSPASLPILQQPISSIPLGTWVPKIGESNGRPFAMLRANASLSDALSLLVQAEVRAVPIVDDNDSLLDIYCRSDITALAKDRAYAQIHLNELSIHQDQALQITQEASASYGFFNGQRCHMCLGSDPLHKVMDRLAIILFVIFKGYSRFFTGSPELPEPLARIVGGSLPVSQTTRGQPRLKSVGVEPLTSRREAGHATNSTTRTEMVDRLTIPGVRRLVIVEAGSKRVEGIISLTDLFHSCQLVTRNVTRKPKI